jgi:glycosyltransferase involved in cell wall biosynthesis
MSGISDAAPSAAGIVRMPSDRLNLLFVGRLDPQKGVDDLLAAMELLTDTPVHLHVIGDGVVSTGKARAARNATFYGWLPHELIPAYLSAADALVMPSRWEGFGLVALEAMRAGRAVIASDAGALPEIVANGETGRIFGKGDPASLAETIRGLSRAELARQGEAGRRRFLAHFTADRMNRETLRLYETVLASRPAPSGHAAELRKAA